MNCDDSLVVTIMVTCYIRSPSNGDHLFTCGAIFRSPHSKAKQSVLRNFVFDYLDEFLTRKVLDKRGTKN